jgi:integrase/recombinase XerC
MRCPPACPRPQCAFHLAQAVGLARPVRLARAGTGDAGQSGRWRQTTQEKQTLPKALPADEAIRLVSQADPARDPDSTLAACNRAMFELLYSSGLRVSELVGIDVTDVREGPYESAGWIDLDEAEVTVTGKGGKKRKVPVGQAALQAILDWLPLRAGLVKADRGTDGHALFLNERGARMSPG